MFAPLESKGTRETYEEFWASKLPPHLEKLDKLCSPSGAFTRAAQSGAYTPGELYLFSMLHQCALVKPDVFTSSPGRSPSGGQPGPLAAFYAKLLADPRTQKVLTGDSPMGPLAQYFVAPPDPE
jgi:hypothetical protein